MSTARNQGPPPPSLLRRAWQLLRSDGPFSFVVTVARHYVIDSRTFYLYEYPLLPPPHVPSHPPEGFDEYFVEGSEAADLLAAGRSDFRNISPKSRRALACGAVAFCLYHGREVAHVGWVATSMEAKRTLEPLPFEIRFDQGEAWAGSVYTVPRYRNQGLLTYSVVRRFDYLRDAGFHTCRAAVLRSNAASNRVQMHFDPRIYAIGRMLKLFTRRRWTERPTTPDDLPPELRGKH